MSIEINGQPPSSVGQNAGSSDVQSLNTTPAQTDGQNASQGQAITDSVTITPSAVHLHAAERQLKAVPVVDVERVEQLRNAIKNGEYEVDPAKIAEKFISLESSLYN